MSVLSRTELERHWRRLLPMLNDGWIVARRNLIRTQRAPDPLIYATIQPIMFVILFAYVFGSAIAVAGVAYHEFLMAGIFTQTVAFGSALTGIGLAEDTSHGIIDRFRALPMSRGAVLVGRTVSDLVNTFAILLVMVIFGLLIGWRTHTGFWQLIVGFGLLLLFAYAMSWVSAAIGLSVRNTAVAQSAGFIWLFPVTFLSNAFVPTAGMPTVVRFLAEWNPISAIVQKLRDLWGNAGGTGQAGSSFPIEYPGWYSLLALAVLFAVFIPLSVSAYRKASAQ